MPTKSNNKGGRGGKRAGAGRKKKAVSDVIEEGFATSIEVIDLPNLVGVDVPKPHQYLSEKQRDGSKNFAEEIYFEIWEWLKKTGCSHLVQKGLVESYSMSMARYIQCEEANNKLGLLAKHPTTGQPIVSPYVNMSIQYQNQANRIWTDIFQIVKENCTQTISLGNPQEDMMEKLLRGAL